MVLGQPDIHMQKNEDGPVCYTAHKIWLQMYQRSKCKSQNDTIFLEEKIVDLNDLGFSNGFFDTTPKAQGAKEK